ncbi:MAG: hypothetical protein LBT00_08125 [Spirochaetaceae bacterium]|jgi:hypothetical protein|nr:hypothetical protein [Spirochaetaceae bacterium]
MLPLLTGETFPRLPFRGRPSHWIASLGNVPLARNDEGLAVTGECCHCETRSGEAIQPVEALTLDCFVVSNYVATSSQ